MNVEPRERPKGILFLQNCIKEYKCQDRAIHNILIFFLSESGLTQQLNAFLREQVENKNNNKSIYFDLDFALRLFDRNKQEEQKIAIYG